MPLPPRGNLIPVPLCSLAQRFIGALCIALRIGREPPLQFVEYALVKPNSITDRVSLGGLRSGSKHSGRKRGGDKLSVCHFLNSILGEQHDPVHP
jgi:hypothetical protein